MPPNYSLTNVKEFQCLTAQENAQPYEEDQICLALLHGFHSNLFLDQNFSCCHFRLKNTPFPILCDFLIIKCHI